jgi:hypothetical protein
MVGAVAEYELTGLTVSPITSAESRLPYALSVHVSGISASVYLKLSRFRPVGQVTICARHTRD